MISTPYDTVSMVRTIEEVLGLDPMGLTDGLATPMADVFTERLLPWSYDALVPQPLTGTQLPLRTAAAAPARHGTRRAAWKPRHDAAWWEAATRGQDFSREDAVDPARFNRVLWAGIRGDVPYPRPRLAGRNAIVTELPRPCHAAGLSRETNTSLDGSGHASPSTLGVPRGGDGSGDPVETP